MRIERLVLENFCQHARLEHDFAPGLTGIVGPVGSGKSTILSALQFALTGRSPTVGNKDEDIRAGTAPKAKARVTVTLRHDGHVYTLVRALQGCKTVLSPAHGTEFTGDTVVNAELSRVLGANLELLPEYVFVRQGRIAAFLDGAEARTRLFQVLFDTRKAERIWKACGEALSDLVIPERSAEIDVIRERVEQHRDRIAALRAERSQYDDVREYDPETDPHVRTVERWKAYEQASAEARRCADRLAECQETANRARSAHAEASVALRERRERAAALGAQRDAARETLAAWKDYEQKRDALQSHRERVRKHESERRSRPDRPEDYRDPDDPSERELERAIKADERLISGCGAHGVTECPTCGTPTTGLADRIEAARQALPEKRERLRVLVERGRRSAAYEQALLRWGEWKKGHDLRSEQLAEDGARLDREATPPAQSAVEAQRIVRDEHMARAQLEGQRDVERAASDSLTRAQARVDEVLAAMERAARTRDANAVSEDEYTAARDAAAAATERIGRRGALLGAIKSTKKQLEDDEASVRRLEEEAARGDRLRAYADLVKEVRGVFHRDAAPRVLAQSNLEEIEEKMNELLDEFALPFRVRACDGLSFSARFHDGKAQPAARLSGGQKVLLAVAFWVAVGEIYTGNIGFLGLDEPTEFLDAGSLGCLEAALARLRTLSETRGFQCLLVTHERRLARLFDDVITFK